MSSELMAYVTATGDEVRLSPEIVKAYLVSGDADKVSAQEVKMFLELCKFQRLNPFLREAYLIKYGTSPATIVTGKETFLKRANRNAAYQGHTTGISEDGKRAWTEVYKAGLAVPVRVEVDYDEYVGKKSDGSITKMWKEKPRTMLKKVSLVQALREAFPDDFGGMYSPEEINTIRDDLPREPIDITPQTKTETVRPAPAAPAEAERQANADIKRHKDEGGDVKEKMKALLVAVSGGDKAKASAILKEVSIFGDPGAEKWIKEITDKTSEKWLGKAYGNLKAKAKDDLGLPDVCPFVSTGCQHITAIEGGASVCTSTGAHCPLDGDIPF